MSDRKKPIENPTEVVPSAMKNPEAKPGYVPEQAIRASEVAHRPRGAVRSSDPYGEDHVARDTPAGVYDDSVKPG